MSKKLLLRRPRYVPNEFINEKETVQETADILTVFKNDIQFEIEALEREYSLTFDDNLDRKRELNENQRQRYNSISVSNKNFECAVVSLNDISNGLKPMKVGTLPKLTEKSVNSKMSTKTVKEYEKLASFFKNERNMFNQNIFEQIEQQLPLSNKSIPKHILLIQLAALLKFQLSTDSEKNISCAITSLPKLNNWNSTPKYEIILYENDDIRDLKTITPNKISNILQRDIANVNIGENQRPVVEEDSDQEITPTKISMMECWMTGKTFLNLGDHSISKIPKLIDIFPFLSILDLSYNNFKLIPDEIFQLQHLHSLNLKNNPLQILNEAISQLTSLRVFICSYTLISNIPTGLMKCENLEQADLSYNNIHFFPNIERPCKLTVLNLSGNPIRYFKKSFTKLKLESLGLENTWTHPVFWKEGEFALHDLENSWAFCDLCDQVINDFPFNLIAFSRRFNHVLPILMSFCSALCRDSF